MSHPTKNKTGKSLPKGLLGNIDPDPNRAPLPPSPLLMWLGRPGLLVAAAATTTPHVKVSAIAFSAEENTDGLTTTTGVDTASFDAGALSGPVAGVAVVASAAFSEASVPGLSGGPLALPLTLPSRDERFGWRVQNTTKFWPPVITCHGFRKPTHVVMERANALE